jgi:hypothetical protein
LRRTSVLSRRTSILSRRTSVLLDGTNVFLSGMPLFYKTGSSLFAVNWRRKILFSLPARGMA